MFHYVDFGEENRSKKKIIKNLKTDSQIDRGVGLTKIQANSVENLLKSCEDIETQATIVLKSLDQSILKNTYFAQEGIHRLYVVIRQGIKALTQTVFRNLPKTDIQNLTDYKKSLEDLYEALDERFQEVNERIFGNEPLKGRTPEQYRRDTGQEYRPPVPASNLRKALLKKQQEEIRTNTSLAQQRRYLQNLQAQKTELEQRLETVDDDMQEISDFLDRKRADLQYRADTFQRQQAQIDSGTLSPKDFETMLKKQDGLNRALNKIQEEIGQAIEQYQNLEMDKQALPTRIQQLELEIQRMGEVPENVIETEPLTDKEYKQQLLLEEKSMIGQKDYELVMKEFKIFINSLNDGLIRFTSGISGKLNKSQITQFRTPVDIAVSKLEGGNFKGHSGYDHKRFL
jgi:chromosome segregation ATPase